MKNCLFILLMMIVTTAIKPGNGKIYHILFIHYLRVNQCLLGSLKAVGLQ